MSTDPKKADLRANSLKRRPAPSATSFHNAGFRQKRPTSRRIPSGCITCRWSSLLGRSLANNVTNALLRPLTLEAMKREGLDALALAEMEPDAGLGNGGLGRLAACFIDSMATMQIPGMGYGLRYEYGIFKQTIKDGWQCEQPDNWLRRPDPWEVARLEESVEIKLNCAFELHNGVLRMVPGQPSSHHRHPVRPSGRRIWREDHQYTPSLGCGGTGLSSTSSNSAAAISWPQWLERSRPNR